jgi:hypothetical protein
MSQERQRDVYGKQRTIDLKVEENKGNCYRHKERQEIVYGIISNDKEYRTMLKDRTMC